jgi:vanillate O-demethylase monooxygenase subunit
LPLDEIRVAETTVSYTRALAPAPLADWEAETMGLPRDRDYQRRHHGTFLSPAVIAEGWEVDGGDAGSPELVRIHAVTPETPSSTHLFFRIARNYALGDAVIDDHLHAVFDRVMAGDIAVVEAIEAAAGYDGAKAGIHLNADAGVLRVRRIVDAMLAAESGRPVRRFAARETA